MILSNKKYTALVFCVLIVLLLWIANLFSFFSISNGFSYDVLMRSYPSTMASEELIVIEADHEYGARGDDVWLTLLDQLLAHDVKQIAFTFMPEQVSERFYQRAVDSGQVVFGVRAVSGAKGFGKVLQPMPVTAADKKTVYGLIDSAPSQHGVSREQHAAVRANGLLFPGFEKQVERRVSGKEGVLTETDFRINFIGADQRIPRLGIQRVLSGGLVNELVADRTVLVGVNGLESMAYYFTPVATDEHLTSDVMFHAFALDTLLSERYIENLPRWAFLLLIILITVASLFFCQWLTFQMSLTLSLVATLIYIFACWLALHVFSIWMPLSELLLAQWLSFALVWRYRVNQENQNLDQMLLGLSQKLREKAKPISFYLTEEPWEQLIAMINQTLNLNRLIFLERVPGDHRLKEIQALNCSKDDIKEKRRDYERTPYSTAISENKPILLDREYLTEIERTEQQYLAPLNFAGEVLGFWAFTVEPDKVILKSKFNALTHHFMMQISEILHYRQEWQKRIQMEQNKLWSYLRIEGGSALLQQLNQSVTLMDRRMFELQEVFNTINTSCILYDLFGRVLLVNKGMEEFAQALDLRLFNITMLEFIIDITGSDEADARNLVQQIIFDHETISLPVLHPVMKRSFMLHMRPLQHQEERIGEELIPDESNVFQSSGVLCELVDMTELKSLYQLKEKMFERFHFQMRNDLSAILFALPMFEDQQADEEEKQFALSNIQGKVDETLNMLELVKQQMDVEIEHMLTNTLLCYPVDGRIPLQKVTAQLKEKIEGREIKIHLRLPELISLVFASQGELETVLHAVLLAMIEDTYEAGDIWIDMKEKDQNMFYHIHNSGIGISDNNLQKYQESGVTQESEILKFHYAIRCVNRWGGSFKITSQIGEGSRAELSLRRFI